MSMDSEQDTAPIAHDLSARASAFVVEYCRDFNGSRAAKAVGYKDNPRRTAFRLLQDPRVQAEVAEITGQRREMNEDLAQQVIDELSAIAFADMRDVAAWGPGGVTVKDSDGLEDDEAATVLEVSQRQHQHGTDIRVKQHSKTDALSMLAKHFGLDRRILEHVGRGGGPIETEAGLSENALRKIRQGIGIAKPEEDDA